MKKLLIFAIVLTLASCRSASPAVLVSDCTEWDFGSAASGDGYLEHTFLVQNKSPFRVVVSGIIPDCSCVRADADVTHLEEGEVASVTVKYDPRGHYGADSHDVFIYDSARRKVLTLTIHASIDQ